MTKHRYLLLFIFSLLLTAVSRHYYLQQHRLEMKTGDARQNLDQIQKSSSAFFTNKDENESTDETSDGQQTETTATCSENCNLPEHAKGHIQGQEHQHGHEHEPEHDHAGQLVAGSATNDIASTADEKQLAVQAGQPHEQTGTHGHEEFNSKAKLLTCEHADHDHADHHEHHAHGQASDPAVSPGFVLLLRQLGFAELAANLLWIQMDSDSHRGLWHRVEFALELIPALDPTFVDAYLLRSFLLDEYQKRHDEALQILEGAAKQLPNRIELWQQIGIFCLNHTGRHGPKRWLPRALEAFQVMAEFSDAPIQSPRLIAVTLAAMERRTEAVKFLEASSGDQTRPLEQRKIDQTMIERINSGEKF